MRKALRSVALAAVLAAAVAPGAAFAAKTGITVGMVLEPPNLDPTAGAAAAIDEVTYANIFQGLTRIDSDGSVQPDLAKSWDISDDGLVYTFHLQVGREIPRRHALHRRRREILARPRPRAGFDQRPEGALRRDQVGRCRRRHDRQGDALPTRRAISSSTWAGATRSSSRPKAPPTNATKPIGTGPFKFVDWVKGDHVDLAKNPDYWGTPAKLDTATFKFISDPTAAFAAMMAGDVDAFPNFPAPETLAQFKADPRFAVVVGTTEGETIMAMNNGKKPFNDLKVRQAVSYAIDRKAIIDGAMFGYGTPIGSHFSPADPGYVDLTGMYAYNPDKAKALLKEAGYPDGFKATLKLPPPSYARRSGEIIAQQLKAVGIQVEIIPVEWAQWLSDVFKNKDYDLTIVSHTEPADIGIYARDDYYFDYHSDAFKKIMDELNLATDPAKRARTARRGAEADRRGRGQRLPLRTPQAGVWNAELKGLWANSPVQANDLTGVYWAN